MNKTSIQGIAGAFHYIAAKKMLSPEVSMKYCKSFTELVTDVKEAKSKSGIMAIENTIAGSLLNNYRLINNSDLFITGEVFIRIKMNLLAHPNTTIENLQEVHSHPIALTQCAEFFKEYPNIKLIAASDTASVAKRIQEENLTEIGALASNEAAQLYGLKTLAEGVETNKENFTRFLKLETKALEGEFNKVSVNFTVGHETGSLYKALGSLYNHQVNLTKIQSLPIIGQPFQYRFFADFLIDTTDVYDKTIIDLSRNTSDLKVLGKYQEGQRFA